MINTVTHSQSTRQSVTRLQDELSAAELDAVVGGQAASAAKLPAPSANKLLPTIAIIAILIG